MYFYCKEVYQLVIITVTYHCFVVVFFLDYMCSLFLLKTLNVLILCNKLIFYSDCLIFFATILSIKPNYEIKRKYFVDDKFYHNCDIVFQEKLFCYLLHNIISQLFYGYDIS